MTSPWLRTLTTDACSKYQLFCLPHAGGNAALYRGWREQLPPEVTLNLVCYPGRLDRLHHPIPDTLPELVNALVQAVSPQLSDRWAIFGHSMGAVVAHELVLALQRKGLPAPQLLAVSAREAPHFHQPGTLHQQQDQALCDELLRLEGTDPALLAMAEMREIILPTMRADYRLIETWQLSSEKPLSCPIAAFVGHRDPELSLSQAQGWADWTTASCTLDVFEGGHFYFSGHQQAVIDRLLMRWRACQTDE